MIAPDPSMSEHCFPLGGIWPESHLLVHCHGRRVQVHRFPCANSRPDAPGLPSLRHFCRVAAGAAAGLADPRIVELGDAMLGRSGSLTAALHRLHRAKLEAQPELAEAMAAAGRAREIERALQDSARSC